MTTRQIIEPGSSVWKACHAERVSVLIDGANYFAALRETLLKAKHAVYIAGWDIDSRMRLVGESGHADDGAPEELRSFLEYLVEQSPALNVYLLLWDYSLFYASEREPLPSLKLEWATPKQIHLCLDSQIPLAASHHQKLVVVDDQIAFCGGLDLTIRRWDTREHAFDAPHRKDPNGRPYNPFHDAQMMVEGPVAAALGNYFRQRWHTSSGTAMSSVDPDSGRSLWPNRLEPDFRDIRVGIARTIPQMNGREEVREIEQLYLRAIATAEKTLYMENQFLNAESVAQAIRKQVENQPDLEVVIVTRENIDGWFEQKTMGVGRRRFLAILEGGKSHDRIRVVRAVVRRESDAKEINIHSKLAIVDDRFLNIGSANLNRRSMGFDTECDLSVEATTVKERETIARIRSNLMAEHLGVSRLDLERSLKKHGSLIRVVENQSGGERSLVSVDRESPEALVDPGLEEKLVKLADPSKPSMTNIPSAEDFQEESGGSRKMRRWIKLGSTVTLIGIAAIWYFTPLRDFADVDSLKPYFKEVAASQWSPLVVPIIFILASLILFPVTILIVLVALTFGPFLGLTYAIVGSVCSAAISFGIGAALGTAGLRKLVGERGNKISRALAKKGILSITVLRLMPIAPFSLVNLVAGASHLRLVDFLIGTVLGMAPGILIMTAIGDRIRHIWNNPNLENLFMLGLIVLGWFGLVFIIQTVASRVRRGTP